MTHLQRTLLGVIGASLVAVGAWGYATGQTNVIYGVLLRTGLVTLSFWLALPQLTSKSLSISTIALVAIVLIVAITSYRPRIMVFVIIAAIVCLLLQTFGRKLTASLSKPRKNS